MTDGVKIAIAPYSCIRSLDLAVKSEGTQLSKLRAVMNAVVKKATQKKTLVLRDASDNFPNKKHGMYSTEPFLNSYKIGTMRAQVWYKIT